VLESAVDRGEHDGDIRLFPVRNEILDPVQDEVIAIRQRGDAQIARIGSGVWLAQAKAA